MRRILAAMLAVLLALPLLTGAAAEEEEKRAALSLTQEELAARFLELKERFPDGTYWNRSVNDSYRDKNGKVITEVFEAVTTHKCDRKNYVCKGMCVGFAWMMADLIYRGYSTGASHTTPGYTRITDRSQMDHVEPGDIISGRCSDFNHEAMVWKVENGKVYVAECWGSSQWGCRINWHYFDGKNKYATWDAIKAATADGNLVLYRHPSYADSKGEEAPQEVASIASEAQPSTQTVTVNGEETEFQMYALLDGDGNATNYISLRQLASAISGTKAQFDVGWSGSVNLVKGVPYSPNGNENDLPFEGVQPYVANLSALRLDGKKVAADSITLTDKAGGGYTYFKLRDLGELLGFTVGWSGETGVTVDTP